jgi:hypothetical protein
MEAHQNEDVWLLHWKELYDSLYIIGPPQSRNRPTPGEKHLANLESILGLRLPSSYRAFAKVFGPGIIARSFVIGAPGYRGKSAVDFLSHNKWQQEESLLRKDSDRVCGLVAFAVFNYEYIVWDRSDCVGDEYKILQVPRGYDDSLIPIADSFASFIHECCLASGYWRLIGCEPLDSWQDEDGQTHSRRCFEPIGEQPNSSV